MNQASAPPLDPRVFEDNLAALRQVDADLAGLIEHAGREIAGAEVARTRDGSLNFRLPDGDERSGWFGRTSIPVVRAEVLLEKFEVGLANVLLPGVGQGQEVTLLLQRLGPHRAVFVWETQIIPVAMALHLHCWADAIAAGRCVFLVCPPEQLAASLVSWLDQHSGHLCPERIMMWPWSVMSDLAACRSAVQAAYEETERCRSAALACERAEYAAAADPATALQTSAAAIETAFTAGPLPVFALQTRDDLRALADAVLTAANAAGLTAVPVLVSRPGDVHPLARLRALRRTCAAPPPAALLLDCSRHQLKEVLPDRTPAVIWLGPAAQPLPNLINGVGRADVVVATSSRVRDRLLAAGWDRPPPPVVPHPCLVAPDAFSDPAAERPVDVLLVADAWPTDPEPYGHHLHTHAQLWRTACELIKARIETFAEGQTETILARAEEKLGFRLEEEEVPGSTGGRNQTARPLGSEGTLPGKPQPALVLQTALVLRRGMLESLGSTVANGLAAAFIAQVLVENKLKVRILGQGWASTPFAGYAEPACMIRDCRRAFSLAKLVVSCDVTGEGAEMALMAAACGAVVVWRSHALDVQPGGMATLLEPGKGMVSFQYARELVTLVRQLIASAEERRRVATAAQARCRADHTPSVCLEALRTAATSYLSGGGGQV